jgi:hypothetical protein
MEIDATITRNEYRNGLIVTPSKGEESERAAEDQILYEALETREKTQQFMRKFSLDRPVAVCDRLKNRSSPESLRRE